MVDIKTFEHWIPNSEKHLLVKFHRDIHIDRRSIDNFN